MFRLTILNALLIVSSYIPAQESDRFVFRNNQNFLITAGIDPEDVKEHPLGSEVAEKLVLLKNRYTYIQPAGPTSPVEKTIISKPVIYNSIQKLNRYFKKALKKGIINIDTARTDFLMCINIALIIQSDNTKEFENYLNKMSSPEEILSAYRKVVLE
jgi:hypothetical protein